MTEQFPTRLFGYSKRSVQDYITKINEECAQKLLDRDKQTLKAAQAARQEMEKLRQENEHLRQEREEVAAALIEAKAYAVELKAQTEERDRAQREKNAALHQEERQRLQLLADRVDALRKEFREILIGMDEELEHCELNCQTLKEQDAAEAPADETPWAPQ